MQPEGTVTARSNLPVKLQLEVECLTMLTRPVASRCYRTAGVLQKHATSDLGRTPRCSCHSGQLSEGGDWVPCQWLRVGRSVPGLRVTGWVVPAGLRLTRLGVGLGHYNVNIELLRITCLYIDIPGRVGPTLTSFRVGTSAGGRHAASDRDDLPDDDVPLS